MSPPRSKPPQLWLLVLLVPMALVLLDFGTRRSRVAAPAEPAEPAELAESAPLPEAARAPRSEAPRSQRWPRFANGVSSASKPATHASSSCMPNARKACHDGDVWWLDSCGRATELIEGCDGRPCLGVGCAPPSPSADACAGLPVQGRCSGDIAAACVAGRPLTFDCAATGQRCATTREGVRCLERSRLDCSATDRAVCDGDALHRCVDGRWDSIDCARRLGRCTESSGTAQCVETQAPRSSKQPLERCNGSDDDSDGQIDEDAVCDAVPLVAFVAGGRVPEDFDARLQRELATVNRVFAPRSFTWVETVPDASPPQVGVDALDALARRLSRSERGRGFDFYIPVLFVEEITTKPPTSGQGSLPNATCGGVRTSDRPAPPEGLVVVSEARQPDTLAHELGHYLGLCHTHEELAAHGLETRTAECEGSGDGICDTPPDPGPDQCALLSTCSTVCADPTAQPDASNVMSYYMPCRSGLSAQQLAVVERGLSLRRGWFRCLDPSQCRCLSGEPGDCPVEMSCQPTDLDGTGVCRLDGPSLPGAPCGDASDCSGGSVCIGDGTGSARASRCVRACRAPDSHCACVDAGLPFQVCSEDL